MQQSDTFSICNIDELIEQITGFKEPFKLNQTGHTYTHIRNTIRLEHRGHL